MRQQRGTAWRAVHTCGVHGPGTVATEPVGGVVKADARRVTLSDVAAASGVSRATVSFVLNDDPNQTISAATRERVRRAARDLRLRAARDRAGAARGLLPDRRPQCRLGA
ncbi:MULTISPECIES: LacI family DNA-binding transcriptional regulator [unclassified Streptomyces]|uniref:LacI family DNA-binding transcriptional regulator n=1 Tax=unclassified Streptomyces TaxID=2593676 RepID=UPI00386ADA64